MATPAQAIALNRFGLGATGDLAPPDPKAWLAGQLTGIPSPDPQQSGDIVAGVFGRLAAIRTARDPAVHAAAQDAMRTENRKIYGNAVQARFDRALSSTTPFAEHLVHFWSNHFAVSIEGKQLMAGLAGAMEEEAVRPHIFGRFVDLLLAVERHAAMEIYLDQAGSIGPGSAFAARFSAKRGLNENLAREILELHTLGVRSGYSQADVTELARALTGWTVAGASAADRDGDGAPGRFRFAADRHEPGARTILGRRFAEDGEAQGIAILEWLATRPETATHLATKLCRHFVADQPSPALVGRVASAYLASGGRLDATYRALIEAPESWSVPYAKFRTPWEWLVAAGRLTGTSGVFSPAPILQKLGQRIWSPGSPAGWPDTAADWAAPDALVRRVEIAPSLAAGLRPAARALADRLLIDGESAATRQSLADADSARQALVLVLLSPEMLRR